MKKSEIKAGELYRLDYQQTYVKILSVTETYDRVHSEGYPAVLVDATKHDPVLLAGITLDQFPVERDDDDPLPAGVTRMVLENFRDIEPADMAQARRSYALSTAHAIRTGLESFAEETLPKLLTAYRDEHWKLLGCADWDGYLKQEFADQLLILQGNADVMVALREGAEMPTRAIASVVRKSHETVRKMLKQRGTGTRTVRDKAGRQQPATKGKRIVRHKSVQGQPPEEHAESKGTEPDTADRIPELKSCLRTGWDFTVTALSVAADKVNRPNEPLDPQVKRKIKRYINIILEWVEEDNESITTQGLVE